MMRDDFWLRFCLSRWITILCFICLPVNLVRAESIDSLQARAGDLIKNSQLVEAAKLHEQVVSIDTGNYESNIWLGNFYFLQGLDLVNTTDQKYNSIQQPSRMQTALYMDELKSIYSDYFLKAQPYLKKALDEHKNEHLLKLLESIDLFSIRTGLQTVQEKRKKKK